MTELGVKEIRSLYRPGMKVRLVEMDDSQAPPVGTCGIIKHIDDIGTIHVNWDNGSSLGLLYGTDKFEIVG